MAVRKPWASLSVSYRERLARKGITPERHRAGESLSEARGHARTPEHPQQADRDAARFRDWFATRRQLVRRLNQRKAQIWGDSHKYRRYSANKITESGVNGKTPSNSLLRWALDASLEELELAAESGDDDYGFLWYH
jgi:hypothetical protein